MLNDLKLLYTRTEIDQAIERMAAQVRADCRDKNPLMLGVLKGTFVFMADLVRQLNFPLEVEFVTLSSYQGAATESSRQVSMVKGPDISLKGRNVVVVEDIVDTGHTLQFLLGFLREKRPASVKVCTLLDKPSRREVEVPIDYRGFEVPNEFIVGYGIDWNEQYRCLPDIYFVERTRCGP